MAQFTMAQFMLSATYYKGLGGSSDCEATHVAYHAQQMYREMVARPRLRQAFTGDYAARECYKQGSMAYEAAVAHGQAIDSRLESQGHNSIYASSWVDQSERLVREFFEAECLLDCELNEDNMVIPSPDLDYDEF